MAAYEEQLAALERTLATADPNSPEYRNAYFSRAELMSPGSRLGAWAGEKIDDLNNTYVDPSALFSTGYGPKGVSLGGVHYDRRKGEGVEMSPPQHRLSPLESRMLASARGAPLTAGESASGVAGQGVPWQVVKGLPAGFVPKHPELGEGGMAALLANSTPGRDRETPKEPLLPSTQDGVQQPTLPDPLASLRGVGTVRGAGYTPKEHTRTPFAADFSGADARLVAADKRLQEMGMPEAEKFSMLEALQKSYAEADAKRKGPTKLADVDQEDKLRAFFDLLTSMGAARKGRLPETMATAGLSFGKAMDATRQKMDTRNEKDYERELARAGQYVTAQGSDVSRKDARGLQEFNFLVKKAEQGMLTAKERNRLDELNTNFRKSENDAQNAAAAMNVGEMNTARRFAAEAGQRADIANANRDWQAQMLKLKAQYDAAKAAGDARQAGMGDGKPIDASNYETFLATDWGQEQKQKLGRVPSPAELNLLRSQQAVIKVLPDGQGVIVPAR